MLNPLKLLIMKNSITLLTAIAALTLALSSCSEERTMPGDTGAEAFLNKTTFLVEELELYNHKRLSTVDLTTSFDSIYFTFNENLGFITKVLNAPATGQIYYQIDTVTINFGGGMLNGIWTNPQSYQEAKGFSRAGSTAGFELAGVSCETGEYISQFIKMTALDHHPKGARVASGLSE
jgi:hypothetical protein